MSRLALKRASKSWLKKGHRYMLETTSQLEIDDAAKTVSDLEIAEYVAASVALHCWDGWSVVGRALDAAVQGNGAVAVHLGYYASLRAAMSLLASQGIGVLNNKHVVLGKSRLHIVSGKTHNFAWDALNDWLALPAAQQEVANLIAVEAKELATWLDGFSPGFQMSSIWTPWLSNIGLVPGLYETDKKNRQDASYRPQGVNPRGEAPVRETAELIRGIWELAEPASGPFFNLSIYLLRIAVEQAGLVLGLGASGPRFDSAVRAMLRSGLVHSPTAQTKYFEFLTRRSSPEDHVVLRVARRASSGRAFESLEAIARAVILLAFATIEANDVLATALYGRDTLRFWWKDLGEERGLWPRNQVPASADGLWPDVERAMESLERWCTTNRATKPSRRVWHRDVGSALHILGGCERIALWGLRL